MDFIREHAGTIITGGIVCAVFAFTIARLVINARKGGCGCGNCSRQER
jgi:hypothetical protein